MTVARLIASIAKHFVILGVPLLFAASLTAAKPALASICWSSPGQSCSSSSGDACDGWAAFYGNALLGQVPIPNKFGDITFVQCNLDRAGWPYKSTVLTCKNGTKAAGGTCVYNYKNAKAVGACEASEGKGCSCNGAAGNPIHTAAGNKHQEETDFTTAGPEPLSFTRYYNSFTLGEGGIGFRWRNTYDRHLTFWGSNNIYAHRHHGEMISYRKSLGLWVRVHGDNPIPFVQVGSDYQMTTPDDVVETYDAEGYLTTLAWPSGYSQTLTYVADPIYDDEFLLASVTDSFGRSLTFTHQDGRIASMTDPDGRVTRYTYLVVDDSYPKPEVLETVAYPDDTPLDDSDNPTRTFHYEDVDFPQFLTGITDETGVRFATWAYDDEGRATLSEHAGGAERVTITYDDSTTTKKRTVTNALGKQATYHFKLKTSEYKLTKIEGHASANCPAADTDFTYNTKGHIKKIVDRNGNETALTYDTTRHLVTSRTEGDTSPVERTTDFTWHADFRVPTQIVAPRKTTDLTYNTAGQPLTRTETDTTSHSVPYSTNGETRTWSYAYNAAGLLASIDGPLSGTGDTTSFTYTTAGYLAKVTDALAHETEVTTHTASGLPLTVDDENGVTTTLAYDPRDRLLSRTVASSQGSAVTGFTYDAVGNVTRITLPDGSYLDYEYDDARRLTAVQNVLGERIEYSLDAMGGVTQSQIKAAGGGLEKILSRTYDELGRLLTSVGAAAQTVTFAYDDEGNLTGITDGLGAATSHAYDALHRLVQTSDRLDGLTDYGYDGQDSLVSVADPRAVTTDYVRNGFGETIQEASPDAGTTVLTRDAQGNVASRTDPRGVVTDYTYDLLGRMTAMSFPASPAEDVAYGYDDVTGGNPGLGRLTSIVDQSDGTAFTYDDRGNVILEQRTIEAQVYDTDYAYDLADNLTQAVYPSGRIVSYARDALGRVTAVTTQEVAGAPSLDVATAIAYKPFGPVASLTHGNGLVLDLAYDQDYRPTGLATGFEQDLTYGYDANDNIVAITDAVTPARGQNFLYDDLERLIQATGQYGAIDYAYDANGNRTSRTLDDGVTIVTETSTIDSASNRLLSVADGSTTRTLGYDAAGNVTGDDGTGVARTLGYDDQGRLVSIAEGALPVASYLHNALGERVKKDAGGAVTHYHYDQAGRLIAESDGATGAATREYIQLAGLPLALVVDIATLPALQQVHADHLGAPQKMTDGVGALIWDASLTPFGLEHAITGTASNDQRFPGQLKDGESGYHYNYFRTYDPSLGRYLQSDPIGLEAGLNRYSYVDGNPANLIDPLGLESIFDGGGIGANPENASAEDIAVATGTTLAPLAALSPATLGFCGRALFGRGGLFNSNRYFRIGTGRKGGRKTIRASGEAVKKATGRDHVDFMDLGPL